MDVTTTITGIEDLDAHLDELVLDPNVPLNAKLFDEVELQLTESNMPPLIGRLLPKITTILSQYTQDPAILASLAIKLLGPVPFTQVLSLAQGDSIEQALNSPAPSAKILGMGVVHKAAASPNDVAILSAMTRVLAAFVRCWLAAPEVEVGQKGGKVLGDLLDVDCELPPPPPGSLGTEVVLRTLPGHGRLWIQMFQQPDLFSVMVDLCAGRHADTARDAKQLSLAQGRLLRLLPRLAAINFRAVTSSRMSLPVPKHVTNGHTTNGHDGASSDAPTPIFTRPRPGEGLLQWAALHMVDRRDVLMHLNVTVFFEAFVSLMRVTEHSAYKVETIRGLLREAMEVDGTLREALLSLPDRTVPEEAEDLRTWIREVLPHHPLRVQGSLV